MFQELQNKNLILSPPSVPLAVEKICFSPQTTAVSPKKTTSAAEMSPLNIERDNATVSMTSPLSAGFVVPSPVAVTAGFVSPTRKSGDIARKSNDVKFIPFFSFCRSVKERKIVFSLFGPLAKNESIPFVQPENYLQMAPSRYNYSYDINTVGGLNNEHIGIPNVLNFCFPKVQKQDGHHIVMFSHGLDHRRTS